ncbi:MAG: hypothetical protein QNK05_25565 [Myxococcota bacterium]|nr:hypothetical protein [Myxococcota bacterium]
MAASVQELLEQLDHEGFLPSEYSVGPPFRDDTLCLCEDAGSWRIYFFERGHEERVAEFTQFSEASEAFLALLRRERA